MKICGNLIDSSFKLASSTFVKYYGLDSLKVGWSGNRFVIVYFEEDFSYGPSLYSSLIEFDLGLPIDSTCNTRENFPIQQGRLAITDQQTCNPKDEVLEV